MKVFLLICVLFLLPLLAGCSRQAAGENQVLPEKSSSTKELQVDPGEKKEDQLRQAEQKTAELEQKAEAATARVQEAKAALKKVEDSVEYLKRKIAANTRAMRYMRAAERQARGQENQKLEAEMVKIQNEKLSPAKALAGAAQRELEDVRQEISENEKATAQAKLQVN